MKEIWVLYPEVNDFLGHFKYKEAVNVQNVQLCGISSEVVGWEI